MSRSEKALFPSFFLYRKLPFYLGKQEIKYLKLKKIFNNFRIEEQRHESMVLYFSAIIVEAALNFLVFCVHKVLKFIKLYRHFRETLPEMSSYC